MSTSTMMPASPSSPPRPAAPAAADAPRPPRPRVVRAEVRAVGDAVRRELVAAAVLMAGVTLMMLFYRVRDGASAHFELVDMTWPVVILALFAPMAVWKGDEPSRRAYLWALPVDRARHTLAKVFAGWMWLTGLVAAYLAWALATALATGGRVSDGIAPPASVDFTLNGHPWLWLVPFVGATAAYLAGSIVAVASDHPWRWFATGFFGSGLLLSLDSAWVERAGQTLIFGPHGANALITATLTGADSLPGALSPPGPWAVTALLWTGLALAGVVAAAHRHQER
jgi:hypothetical protein